MKITPLQNNILVKPVPAPKNSILIVPDDQAELPFVGHGVVVAVGKFAPVTVKTGDKILYFTNNAKKMPDDNVMIKPEDLWGLVDYEA